MAAAFAPAGVGLALLVATVEIRMDDPWSLGVLLLVAGVPALVLLLLGLAAARDDDPVPAAATILLVAGLALAAVAIVRLGNVLAGENFSDDGGTLTWMLALFTAVAAFCANRTRSAACLLIASLAAVGLLLEAVNWIFGIEDMDTFRALLVVSFVVLFCAGLLVPGRDGTILVGAAGVTVLAGSYVTGFALAFGFPGPGLGWGWELALLAEGAALLVYAAVQLEPGPAYFAFFVLAIFAITTAFTGGGEGGLGFEGESPQEADEPSLVGWPLAIAIGTAAAALWGVRRARET